MNDEIIINGKLSMMNEKENSQYITHNSPLKKGYKQTEVGVIPEDWEIEPLSEIAHFENGKAHEQFIDEQGDFVVVNSKFISTKGRVRKYSNKNIFPLKKDDITIVMSDIPNGKALAKCFFIDQENKYTLNQRIGRITSNDDTDNKYLFYKLNRNKYYLAFDSGTGQTNIKRQEILDCPVVLPPTKAEQTAIATALSDMDSLIEGLEKLLVKKQNIKQGAMQELLTGRKRIVNGKLSMVNEKENSQFITHISPLKKGYKQTEVGVIPEDWEVKKLGDIADIQRGASPRPIDSPLWFDKNSGIGWLRISDVSKSNKYLYQTVQSLSKEGIANSRFVKKNSLIMSICATVGRPIVSKKDVCIHDGFVVFRNLSTEEEYLYYTLEDIEKNWSKSGQTGSQMNLNTSLINSTKIPLPPTKAEQTAIAQILSDMDTEIEQLETQLSKYKMLKTGMMQELLTGKKRLI